MALFRWNNDLAADVLRDTVMQGLTDGFVELSLRAAAAGGRAMNRNETIETLLAKMAGWIRSKPYLLEGVRSLAQWLKRGGSSLVQEMARRIMQARGVDRETENVVIDIIDDWIEAMAKTGIDALTAANLDAYVAAATARIAAKHPTWNPPNPSTAASAAHGVPMHPIPTTPNGVTLTAEAAMVVAGKMAESEDFARCWTIFWGRYIEATEGDVTDEMKAARKTGEDVVSAVNQAPVGVCSVLAIQAGRGDDEAAITAFIGTCKCLSPGNSKAARMGDLLDRLVTAEDKEAVVREIREVMEWSVWGAKATLRTLLITVAVLVLAIPVFASAGLYNAYLGFSAVDALGEHVIDVSRLGFSVGLFVISAACFGGIQIVINMIQAIMKTAVKVLGKPFEMAGRFLQELLEMVTGNPTPSTHTAAP